MEEKETLLARLHESEQRLQHLSRELETEKTVLDTILQAAPIGFAFLDKALRYLRINETLAVINGVSVAQHLGRTLAEVVPDLAPKVETLFRGVLETGKSISLELTGETPKQPGVQRHWSEHIYRVQNAQGETLGLGVMVQEITERKRAELSTKFLLDLSANTRYLSNADDIEYTVIKSLGEHLSATNCTFSRVNIVEGTITVSQQWGDERATDFTGVYHLQDFMPTELIIEQQAGLTVCIAEIARDPRTAPYQTNFAALGIAAILVAPYLEEGVWVGTLTVSCRDAHVWREDEIELAETVLRQVYPLLKRLRTEAALRESEARFRTLAETLPGFVWMDSEGGTNIYMNPRWSEFTGLSVEAARDEGWQQVTHPGDMPRVAERWSQSRRSGEAYELELRHRHKDGSYHWFLAKGLPLKDDNGTITHWVGTSTDIHERKQQEFDASFLLLLSTRLAQLSGAAEIEETVTRLLGEYLAVDRCYSAQVDEETDTFTAFHEWHNADVKSIKGDYHFSDFVAPTFLEQARASQTMVVYDVNTASHTAHAEKFQSAHAFIFVPRLEFGKVVKLFGVSCLAPRVWQANEIGVVESAARQLWPALDKAKAEETLRQSEERYRTLFTSIDEGFSIIEMIFDEAGKPCDYCFLEINPMFEKLTGLKDALGKTAKELVPGLEPHWFDLYGSVALTGESIRFSDESQAMDGRWFEVYASRLGGAESRKVAIVFNNITERKRAEHALLEGEARLSLAVQAGNLGTWDSHLLERKTYWSSEQERLFGLEPGTFDGEFSKYVHSEDRMRVLRKIAEVKASGENYADEFRIVRPDGGVRWLAGRGRVIRDGSGQAVRLIGVNFDVTERKQKELNSNFLLELNRNVRTLSKADDIEQAVIQVLGSYLQVTNCNFSKVDVTKDWLEVCFNYQQGSTVKLEGTYKLSEYIAPEFIRHYAQGEAVAIADVKQDWRTKGYLEKISTLGLKSLLVVPYLNEGRWVAALNLSCNTLRQWRKDELELAETVAAQFIPAIERARTEAVATLLGERFRLTETSAKSFLYEWDVPSGQVWRSEGFEAVTGFRSEDIPNNADWWNERVHPHDVAGAQASQVSLFASGGEYSAEYRVRRKDGAYIYLWDRGRVILDEHGKTKQLLGTSTDITQQKKLELELAETAARLDSTIAFLPLGFCLLSSDYRYIRINSVLADINGLSVEEHLGQKVPELLPQVWKMIEPALRQIEATGEPVLNVEVKHLTDERVWLVSYYPVPDIDGGLLGFGSVALEITERQEALNTLRETNVKLRDLTERQQRFVADAAHELRAPLTSVRGNLDLLTHYPDIPKDEEREMLSDLQQEAVRLSNLVEDLLELARSDSGLKMKKESVNLTEILLSTWQRVQTYNTAHTFELENMPSIQIIGDGDRLKQLALILLENAAKYTPEGGTICMGLAQNKSDALFYIRDTGIGIAKSDLAHVFERFYRADKARTRAEDPGGTGLGLSIAEWIVNGHKGKIWLESEAGQGTTAFVQLPLYSA